MLIPMLRLAVTVRVKNDENGNAQLNCNCKGL
jgi:hypothetical protein